MKIGAVTSPLWNNENMITDHEYNTKKGPYRNKCLYLLKRLLQYKGTNWQVYPQLWYAIVLNGFSSVVVMI